MAPCFRCEKPVEGRWREQRGWVERRTQGGTNQLTLPEDTGRWACNACIEELRRGMPPGTQAML